MDVPVNPDLKNRRVITHQKLILGIPAKVFLGVSVLAMIGVLAFFIYLPKFIAVLASVLLIFIFITPLYIVHKDDVEAWQIYIKLIFQRGSRFSAAQYQARRVSVLSVDSDNEIGFQTLSETIKS